MKRIKIIIILLGGLFPVSNIFSQSNETTQRITVKSPEVAAFEKVVEIPVNTYTGVPEISIPIYTVNSGDISLPISLDYHASAIRVDQEATWVGLNWNLNAGGVISTQIAPPTAAGLVNDWKYLFDNLVLNPGPFSNWFGNCAVGPSELGLYYKMGGNHEMNQVGLFGMNRFHCMESQETNDISFDLYDRILTNGEGEAQLFFANFMGRSFKFAYNILQNKYIIVGKDQRVKIEGSPFAISKITDVDGTQFLFGAVETTVPDYTGGDFNSRAVSFYLSQIISPTGRIINLSYKKYGTISPLPSVTETAYFDFPEKVNNKVERKLSPSMSINNSYLYEITSDDAIVRFDVGSRTDLRGTGKKLESITIINRATNKPIKKFKFAYNYFVGNNVGGNSIKDYYTYCLKNSAGYTSNYNDSYVYNRLMLVSVTEQSVNESGVVTGSLPPYSFSYNSPELPCKRSAAVDYWGFYNGKENSGGGFGHMLIVNKSHSAEDAYNAYPYVQAIPYADNRPNPNTVKAGLLTGIQYPTGGSTEFYYEPHRFTNYMYFDCNTNSAPPVISVSTMDTNTNSTIPADLTGPRDFTVTTEAEVEITVKWTNRPAYYWKDMWSSPALLMKYETITTPNGPVEIMSGFKTWMLTSADTLNTKEVKKKYVLTLLPGKYQLRPIISSPQIMPYNNFPGDKRVEIYVKDTSTKLSTGAGVRIKEIRQRENTNVTSTHYSYVTETEAPSGILMSPVKFARRKLLLYQNSIILLSSKGDVVISGPRPPVLKSYWIQSSVNMVPAVETKVGYSRVVVTKNGGKIVYEFWNKKLNTNALLDYCKPLGDPRNGNLLKQCIYDSSGKLKHEVENVYTILNKEFHHINLVAEDIYYGFENCVTTGEHPNLYAAVMESGRMMLYVYPSAKFWIERTRQTVKEYVDNEIITTDYIYTYNPSNLLVSSVAQSVYGSSDKKTNYFIYPQDYDLSNGNVFSTLVDNHILSKPIEKVTVLENLSSSCVTSGIINKYDSKGQLIEFQQLGIQESLQLNHFCFSNKSTNGVLGTVQGGSSGFTPFRNYKVNAIYGYSENGNLVHLKENGFGNVVYLWGYNKQYLIAEIVNATYSDVQYALGCTTDNLMAQLESQNTPDIVGIRQKLDAYFKNSMVQITTYTHIPLVGMTIKTDPRGVMTSYEYDTFGRLVNVKDHFGKTIQHYQYKYKQ